MMERNDQDNNLTSDEGWSCIAAKDDGSPCRAKAMHGEHFCYFHHPAKAIERESAQRRGGESNRSPVLPPESEDFIVTNRSDLRMLLNTTINDVRKGRIGAKEANVIAVLAFNLERTLEDAKLEERLAELERAAGKGSPRNG